MGLAYVVMQVVIAGGGLAGLRAVEVLRARDFGGPITMIAAESRPPYDRPPLSKTALSEQTQSERTLREPSAPAPPSSGDAVRRRPAGRGSGRRAGRRRDRVPSWTPRCRPTSPRSASTCGSVSPRPPWSWPGPPDRSPRSAGPAGLVRTARGEYPFDRLVVATGADPIVLPGPGRQRFLRTHEDALELRDRLQPGVRLVVVGRGLDRGRARHRRGRPWLPRRRRRGRPGSAGGCDRCRGRRADRPLVRGRGRRAADVAGRRVGQDGGLALTRRRLDSGRRDRHRGRRPARRWLAGRFRIWPWTTGSPSTRVCGRPRRTSTRSVTARRSCRCGTDGGSVSSTGTSRCGRPRSSRPTSWARTRCTTRCRTPGPSSSAG